jgi:hypothetical protein
VSSADIREQVPSGQGLPADGNGAAVHELPPTSELTDEQSALIAEACSKSSLLWLRPADSDRPQLAWHTWVEGTVLVISGPGEQTLPPLSGPVEVITRSKDTGTRLVTFLASGQELSTQDETRQTALDALAAARLNAQDTQEQAERWRSTAVVTRLTPLRVLSSGAGNDETLAQLLVPPPSPATTVGTHQPWHTKGRAGARRAKRRGNRQ